ncbi:MAG: HTH domain-containing protein [Minisyncoccales bacterium]
MFVNYQKICNDILKCLPQERTKNIISRRFGFSADKKETLESIGKSYNITRERVRQIEEDGFKKAKVKAAQIAQKPFQVFIQELKNFGGLKREDLLLEKLGGKNFKPQVLFLLTLGKQFERFSETNLFHAFWTIDKNSLSSAQKTINNFTDELKKKRQPLSLKDISLVNYIELSKQILKGPEGLYGFFDWPEINPKGIKDKAFLVMKRENKPLHFTKVAEFIEAQEQEKKPCLVKTVHNELIKDQRFVLVGRGLYALRDWGYTPGVVKDVIKNVLKESQEPLSSKAIVKQVLSQRFVQKNTILLNLQNKEYFFRSAQGKYTIKEA